MVMNMIGRYPNGSRRDKLDSVMSGMYNKAWRVRAFYPQMNKKGGICERYRLQSRCQERESIIPDGPESAELLALIVLIIVNYIAEQDHQNNLTT